MKVLPFESPHEQEALALMMHCIRGIKKREFDAEHDKDMLDLANYYSPKESSLLAIALSEQEKVVGTLGLKCEGMIDGRKTGTLKRLYVESEHRSAVLLPMFRIMREHVIAQHFETLRFIARQRMGSIFQTYSGLAKHLGMKQESLDNESILYTWKLPPMNGLLPKLFKQ